MVDFDTQQRTILSEAEELLRRVVMHRKGETKALDVLVEKLKELVELREKAPSGSQTGAETSTLKRR